jgi:hypothetical protein
MFANAKSLSASVLEVDVPQVPTTRESGREGDDANNIPASTADPKIQTKHRDNVVCFPFVTAEVRACAKLCGLAPEIYIKKVLAFANSAVRDDEKRQFMIGA